MALTAGNDRNGCGACNPSLMTSHSGLNQYGVLTRRATSTDPWGVTVFKRVLSTGVVTTFDLKDSAVAVAAGITPVGLGDAAGIDNHWNIDCKVDEHERLHLYGNCHATRMRYIRSGVGDITSWTDVASTDALYATMPWAGLGVNRHTYGYSCRLSDGTLLWFFTQEDSLSTTRGRDVLGFKLAPGAGTAWTAIRGDGHFATTATVNDGTANRAYITGLVVDPITDRIWVAGIWRTNDADADSQQRPWIVYSDDAGATWATVTGAVQAMPLTWANSVPATITSAPGFSRTGGQGIALDSDWNPHTVWRNGNSVGTGAIAGIGSFVHAWWDGTAWQNGDIHAPSGGFGPILNQVPAGGHDLYSAGPVLLAGEYRPRVWSRAGSLTDPDGLNWLHGGPIESNEWQAICDPERLRMHGILSLMVPDGDTAAFYEFGQHHRAYAS